MAIPALKKRDLSLIIVADKSFIPYTQFRDLEIQNYPWSSDNWLDDILRGDIVINPTYDKGRFKYKSDNKTTQAWALGMPVAKIDKDLDRLVSEESRKKEAKEKLALVHKDFNVLKSVIELKDVIEEIHANKDFSKSPIV